jgi:hypothetical protein
MQKMLIVVALALLLCGQRSLAAPPFEQARSLAFLQDRGGIAVDKVFRKNGDWLLPVACNVSGIKTITTTPTTIHASLAWSKSVAWIEEGHIYLQVFTAMQGPRAPSAECGPAALRHTQRGVYPVYFVDPDETTHLLTSVEIP